MDSMWMDMETDIPISLARNAKKPSSCVLSKNYVGLDVVLWRIENPFQRIAL
jgi:hypothetical protein